MPAANYMQYGIVHNLEIILISLVFSITFSNRSYFFKTMIREVNFSIIILLIKLITSGTLDTIIKEDFLFTFSNLIITKTILKSYL